MTQDTISLARSHSQISGNVVEGCTYSLQLLEDSIERPLQNLVFLGHMNAGVLLVRFGQFLQDAIVNSVFHDVYPPFAASPMDFLRIQ